SLRCEVDTLGYPKAALLGFALAVCACDVLRVVSGALEQVEGPPACEPDDVWEASSYAVAVELRVAYDGLVVNVPNAVWDAFAGWSARQLAAWLVEVARKAERKRYRKSSRGPKKAVERIKAGRKA